MQSPTEVVIEPCLDDLPDFDTEPVMAYANGCLDASTRRKVGSSK